VTVNESMTFKARIRQGADWSALTEAAFRVRSRLDALRVTEVMYNPPASDTLAGDQFEFIELKNTGPDFLDLTGVAFTQGVQYAMPEGTGLEPGAFLVLASNGNAFRSRYPGVTVGGIYAGRLDNDGDTVALVDAAGDALISFKYGDAGWWPREADGEGRSLVPADPAEVSDLDAPASWAASSALLGSPGADDEATAPAVPRFLLQPVDTTVRAGERATFTAMASGFPDPTYRWQRDGVDLPGATGSTYMTPPATPADDRALYRCIVRNSEGSATSREAVLSVVTPPAPFRRGDGNADGAVDISDAIAVLRFLFAGSAAPCDDAADANDSGTLDIADAVFVLSHLFAGGVKPPQPFPSCGVDATGDDLDCASYGECP
jgi:hypothetical protein